MIDPQERNAPECARISQLFRAAFDGDPWYGSPLTAILDEISAAEASARPFPGAASIWEVILHVTAWTREVRRRLPGGEPAMPEEGDWPSPPAPSEEGWSAARSTLTSEIELLAAEIERFPDARLEEIVGRSERSPALGTGTTFYSMLHGVVQHMVYHTAQIAALRKALFAGQGRS